jgi:hypothetical protein
MDSLILQTAFGLVFVFASFTALASVITELVARFLGLRGEYLLRGIRSLLDDGAEFQLGFLDMFRRRATVPVPKREDRIMEEVVTHPLVAGQADKAAMPANAGIDKQRRKLPSYASGRSFARALIDLVVPDSTGRTTVDAIESALRQSELPDPLKKSLLALLTDANGDVAAFRKNVEQWYDDHMARVSGWYKRHVRWITVGISALLVLSFNLSAVEIARSLYTDEALRGAMVTQAADAAECSGTAATCLGELRDEIDRMGAVGLPIGWGTVPDCAGADPACGWLDRHGLGDTDTGGIDLGPILLVGLGWMLMVLALLPGARFWFDALSRLGSLRSTGPKPATADGPARSGQ